MGPKKTPTKDPADPEAEKQFREKQIAQELFQTEIQAQLHKPTKKIVDIDDENATLASMINNRTLVPPENPRDLGSQLYHTILYVFGMTPKLMSILRRMRYFSEEQIDEHINWFNDTFDGTVTRVKEIAYTKTTFDPRMSGLHKHTKLNFLMLGHRSRLPVDLLFPTVSQDENSQTTDEYVMSLYDKLKLALASVRETTILEAQRQKLHYNHKARGVELYLGDKVLVKLDAFRGQWQKLKNQWGDTLYIVDKCVADGIPAY